MSGSSRGAATIGLFDRGLGGVTVLAALRRRTAARLIFLADSGRLGAVRSEEEIVRSSLEMARFLRAQGAEELVIACNSAETHARGELERVLGIPVHGVIEACARTAVAATTTGTIGVVATGKTILSHIYRRTVESVAPNVEVQEIRCSGIVEFIERGELDHPELRTRVTAALQPLDPRVDTLILGCTHFPLIADLLRESIAREITLVEGADMVASQIVESSADRREATEPTNGSTIIWTSGAPSIIARYAADLGLPAFDLRVWTPRE